MEDGDDCHCHQCCWCEFKTIDLYLFYCHSWVAHRAFQFSLKDESSGEGLSFYPCELCGKGSGVVFSTLGNLHDHLFEHLFEEEITIPQHLKQYEADVNKKLAHGDDEKDEE
eukprot:m.242040 g.242040  ORF g.242040 m.242040 type:complete len:112 (-) comp29279_c0_seq1:213-548(-)